MNTLCGHTRVASVQVSYLHSSALRASLKPNSNICKLYLFSWKPCSDTNKEPAFYIRRVALNCVQIKKKKYLPHICPPR